MFGYLIDWGTSKYFYGHFEPRKHTWTSRDELMNFFPSSTTGFRGQTTVAEPDIRKNKSKSKRIKPDYAAEDLPFVYGNNYACQSLNR